MSDRDTKPDLTTEETMHDLTPLVRRCCKCGRHLYLRDFPMPATPGPIETCSECSGSTNVIPPHDVRGALFAAAERGLIPIPQETRR